MSTNDTSRGVAPVPNYVNPTSRGPVILVLICTLVPLATVVVFTRMWVRIRIVRSVWLDDYLIMASLVRSRSTTGHAATPLTLSLNRSLRGPWPFQWA